MSLHLGAIFSLLASVSLTARDLGLFGKVDVVLDKAGKNIKTIHFTD